MASPSVVHETNWRSVIAGLWRLADPKIALASLVPFCTGAALAWRETGELDLTLAAVAFIAIFLIEVGKNAVNDLYDFRSGADTALRPDERSPFSGGKRVLVDHLLLEDDLSAIAWIAFGLAAIAGWSIAASRPILLLLGFAAAAVSILYAMPPVHLSYRGLGELAVFTVYGPGIVFGTMLLFAAPIGSEVLVTAVTLGILIALVLIMNEVPDERADRLAGKRTLVVRLGRQRTSLLTSVLFTLAFAIPLVAVIGGSPAYLLATWSGAPFAAYANWRLRRQPSGPPVMAQTVTLVTYVVTGVALTIAAIVID